MPCTQTGSLQGDEILALQSSLERKENIVTIQAQLLCEATKIIADNKLLGECSSSLRSWFDEHVILDNQRKGLKKLTWEEIKALGLENIADQFD